MPTLTLLAQLLAVIVSVTVVATFLREIALTARLRRRETYYREAGSSEALAAPDREVLLKLRREALAKLVSRESNPYSRRRYAFLGLLIGLYFTVILALSLTSFFEEGYVAFRTNTGDLGWFILLLWPLVGLAPTVHGVQAWQDVKARREEHERAFLGAREPVNKPSVGTWSYDTWAVTTLEARVSAGLLSGALLVGIAIEAPISGAATPSRGTSVLLLLGILGLALSLFTFRRERESTRVAPAITPRGSRTQRKNRRANGRRESRRQSATETRPEAGTLPANE